MIYEIIKQKQNELLVETKLLSHKKNEQSPYGKSIGKFGLELGDHIVHSKNLEVTIFGTPDVSCRLKIENLYLGKLGIRIPKLGVNSVWDAWVSLGVLKFKM